MLILAGITISFVLSDGGIFSQAQKAKEQTAKGQALEEVNLAVSNLFIKQNIQPMTQEERRASLENELKQIHVGSTVQIVENGFKVNHRGYEVQIDDNYKASIKNPFNAEEWDKLAATEDCFQWGSNTLGEEGYDVIIGYTEKAQSYTKLRVPSRCKRIICDDTFYGGHTDDTIVGRAFIANVQEIEIPSTVVEIGAYAISKGSLTTSPSPEKILIPDSVTSIGFSAFLNCKSLKEVTIPNSVTNIGNYAFFGCTSLKEITIPRSVTSFGNYAFHNCTSLTGITFPDSVTSIGNDAFSGCTSLKEITIPNSVTSIGNYAFFGCTSLKEITIPNSVTSIGSHAFYNCTSLTEITIPDSVTSIENDAFYNCNITVKCRASEKPVGWNTNWNRKNLSGEIVNVIWGYTGE